MSPRPPLWARVIGGAAAVLLGAVAPRDAAHAFPIGLIATPSPAARAARPDVPWNVAQMWNGLAPCLHAPDPWPQMTAIAATSAGSVDAVVAGFDLRAQTPEAVAAFRGLTAGRAAQARAAAAQARAPWCHDVGCAMNALFGEDRAPRLLRLAVDYHFDAADLAGEADRPWRDDELDDILAALEDLPQDWFAQSGPRLRILQLRDEEARIRFGPAPPGAGELVAVAGEGYPGILVAGAWRRLDRNRRRVIMVHELAHEYARMVGTRRLRAAWLEIMAKDRRATGGAASVSAYADTDPDEDFAESVAAYRYAAPHLKGRAPERFAFLRDHVFDGASFGSAAGCRPTTPS